MNSKQNLHNTTRKSTYAERLEKEIATRKTSSSLTAILVKLNPFSGLSK